MKAHWYAVTLLALAWTAAPAAGAEPAPSPAATATPELEGAADDTEGQPVQIFWKDGKTHLKSKSGEVAISHRFQFRFNYLDPDSSVQLPGTTERGQGKGGFRVRRAKTTFEGWFWKPELTYELQLSWAGPEAGASTETPLEDLYLNWDFSKNESAQLAFGQYKVPLGRQETTTSIGLQFADRSLLSGEFTRGRDLGLQLHGRVARKTLHYYLGVFNGNAASRLNNENTKFQYNARLVFEPWGTVGNSEGDFESKDHPLLALAAQVENNNQHGSTSGLGGVAASDLNTTVVGGDLVFKYKGASVFGEYFYRDRKPTSGARFTSNGYNVQIGFFPLRDRLELAFRYAGWDPTDLVVNNDQTETGAVINYFLRGHRFKLQSDFRQLKDDARRETTRELRVQVYVQF
jgi:phosphate-selective porin OprO and OprP